MKNLVLAGIRATICDSRSFPSAVAETPSFLLPPSATSEPAAKKTKYESVGQAVKPVVENMNLLLGDCPVIDKEVSELDEALLKDFPIVIASRISLKEAKRLAKIITAAGNKFFMADCFGMYGASLMDLGEHSFRPEVGKKLLDPKPLTPQIPLDKLADTPLEDAVNRFHKQHPPPVWMRYRAILEYRDQAGKSPTLADEEEFAKSTKEWIRKSSPKLADHVLFQDDALKGLAKVAGAEIAPICAVLGGILGNEVIKAISGKGEPANNTVLFDGETCKAWTFLVKPKE